MLLSMADRFSPEGKQKERLALQLLQQQISGLGSAEARAGSAEARAQEAHAAQLARSATRDPLELAMLRETGEGARVAREASQAKAPHELAAAKTAQELVQEQLLGEREARPQRAAKFQSDINLANVQATTAANEMDYKRQQAEAIGAGAKSEADSKRRTVRLAELEFLRGAGPRGAGGQPMPLSQNIINEIAPGAFKSPLDPAMVGQAVQDFYTGGDPRAGAIKRILENPELKEGVLQMDPSIGDVLSKGVQGAPGQGPLAVPQPQVPGAQSPRVSPQMFEKERLESASRHLDPEVLGQYGGPGAAYHLGAHATNVVRSKAAEALQGPVMGIADYVRNMMDPQYFRQQQEQKRKKLGY